MVTNMTVNYQEYAKLKNEFFKKHDFDYGIKTSQMDEYGQYHKEYLFLDDAVWYESYRPTFEKVEIEVKKVKVEIEVKLFCTEFWSTDDSNSKCMYEKF